MIMNKKGQAQGALSTFIIALIGVTAIFFIYTNAVAEVNDAYGTSNSVTGLDGLNTTNEIQSITTDLNDQFTGANATAASGGSLGESFNQVYTLGIVTTRIIGTLTPGVYAGVIVTLADVFDVDPSLIGLAIFAMTILLISGLLAILLGRAL